MSRARTGRDTAWDEVWQLLEEERNSLLAILRALQGHGLGTAEAEEILHSFALDVMPRVLERTLGWSQQDRARYLRASLRNFARSAVRTLTRETAALSRLANEPQDWAPERDEQAPNPAALERAMAQLPADCAAAVAAFLGVEGAAMSIRDVAKRLGRSRYATTLLIQDGLIGAAIALRQTGVLSALEVESCRRIVLDGESIAETAVALNMSPARVRNVLRQARRVVSSIIHEPERKDHHHV